MKLNRQEFLCFKKNFRSRKRFGSFVLKWGAFDIMDYGSLILTQSISIRMGSTLKEDTDMPTSPLRRP